MSTSPILIFGGNGFIGRETVRQLLDSSQTKHTIIVANRGKSWDWDSRDTIFPHVTHVYCDREKPLKRSKAFMEVVEKYDEFRAVVDFSAYDGYAVKQAMHVLQGRTKLYLYISSDSVYEVCEKTHHENTRETDAKRPADRSQVKMLKRKDKYGHKKLKGEEALRCQTQHPDSIPFVILRLADVIGFQDSTDRWWQYQLWLKLCDELDLPLHISPELRDQKISLVYVKDVALVIASIISMSPGKQDGLLNHAFNIAFQEAVTVEELLSLGRSALGVNPVQFDYSPHGDVPWIYPSVEKGPVDISKACKILNFQPTPLSNAVTDIVASYEEIVDKNQFKRERRDILMTVFKDLQPIYTIDDMKATLSKLLKL